MGLPHHQHQTRTTTCDVHHTHNQSMRITFVTDFTEKNVDFIASTQLLAAPHPAAAGGSGEAGVQHNA